MNWPGERDGDAWVFGYGSLMWNPCFRYVESRRALLRGYHRSLCILSLRNRGTTDKPGLALGLDRGGSCNGFAFRVFAGDVAEVRSLLWQREMPNDAYEPKLLPVRLEAGARAPALAFIARREHRQYVGDLKLERAAALVVQGVGASGTALDHRRLPSASCIGAGGDDVGRTRSNMSAQARLATARRLAGFPPLDSVHRAGANRAQPA